MYMCIIACINFKIHEASHEEHTYMYDVCVHVHVVCMYYHGTIHTYIHKLHTYITYILMCVWTDPIVHIHVVCSISVYTCTTVNEM